MLESGLPSVQAAVPVWAVLLQPGHDGAVVYIPGEKDSNRVVNYPIIWLPLCMVPNTHLLLGPDSLAWT